MQQGAGGWAGGCSTQSLQQRVEELEAVVIAAVQEAIPANTPHVQQQQQQHQEGQAPEQRTSIKLKQQHYHRREDAFKLELASFVAEFATSGPL